jgi:CHAT domain-containing protein/Tfp pilus assembly protein PilF
MEETVNQRRHLKQALPALLVPADKRESNFSLTSGSCTVTNPNSILPLAAVVCLFAAFALGQQASLGLESVLKKGVIVESLIPNQEGEKAGILPGDVLLSWSRGDVAGEIDSPFDLPFVRTEQASRGPLKLIGLRGSHKCSWTLGPELWGIWTYPNFHGESLLSFQEGRELERAGRLDEALGRWRKTAAIADLPEIPWLRSWLLSRAARMYGDRWNENAGFYDRQDSLYQEAIGVATRSAPEVRADLLRQRAETYQRRSDYAHFQEYQEERLLELRKLSDKRMALPDALLSLAWVTSIRGDNVNAENYAREALTISKVEAPHSIETIAALESLGSTLVDNGDYANGAKYSLQALDSIERYYPNSLRLAPILEDLGGLASNRGELAKAQLYFRRAVSVVERVYPNGLGLAHPLNLLAECLIDQGDLKHAERYELRALAITHKLAPGGLGLAASLRDLGEIARLRGDFDKANGYYQHALAIGERTAPLSFETHQFLIGLGYVARDRGDPVLAETYFRKALGILDKSVPGSLNHAETLADLADALYRQKKLDAATETYEKAFAELNESGRMGTMPEDRSHYRAYRASYYEEYVGLLIQQRQVEKAFEAVEGSRARSLIEMLSESQIDVHQGADINLLSRERELRGSLNAKSQARIRLLNDEHTVEQVSDLEAKIRNIQDQYERVKAEIRSTSPGFAALSQPQPLTANEIKQLLDPETVLLEYFLGKERSYVWLVTNNSLEVHALPRRAEIEALARRLYWALTGRTHKENTDPDANLANWAQADTRASGLGTCLSRMLLGSVAKLIKGKRLLVVSDGALQYIPFSALPAPGNANEPLIVEHEIVNLPSASVLSEIRRASAHRPPASREVAVLADPVFDASDDRVNPSSNGSTIKPGLTRASPRVRMSAMDVGLSGKRELYLGRLVYSRSEAEAILAVAPRHKTLEALDFEASRETALSPELAQYRIVHFATHGFLDSKRPEFSGLVLSLVNPQGKPEDGFLGLEDVYNLKLPVDMVVLSGCQTGLGEDVSGEGLIGLTRGFMYAGASRVVASLWSVDDFTTSQLMAKFYRAVERDKLPPAAALRKAQIEMWRHRGWQAPYYWAAFQLQGEWK